MGDRALIQLTNDSGTLSPILYLHWGGSSVGDILQAAQTRMAKRPNDVEYAFARLVAQACIRDDASTATGVGVMLPMTESDDGRPRPLVADDSHGDAGCFLVNVTKAKWRIEAGGGYGIIDNPIMLDGTNPLA